MARVEDLLGSWRMVSWTVTSTATGEARDALGPDPVGYIAYHADGRMMASIFGRQRPRAGPAGWSGADKAALFDTMVAYVAAWRIEGDRVIHEVERAWNPAWEVALARPFTLDGARLVISGAPGLDPATGEEVVNRIEFEKV